jgi:riboflavin kinase/FMN adenylyltransferase
VRVVRLGDGVPLGLDCAVVTIGNFDGVHRGHRELVERVVGRARSTTGAAVVRTFDPHPGRVLAPARAPLSLSTPVQKRELLAALGVDVAAELPFTAAVAALSADDFVRQVLLGEIQARHVIVGETFRFGRGRAGDVPALTRLGVAGGFSVEPVAPVLEAGKPVSSSRVREALATGDTAAAARLLGRAFFIDATVVRGDGRGRTIGVPTANLESGNEILPARGVYAGRCRLADGSWRAAVVNRGRRPTFGGETETVEAHLLDFDGDLYGSKLRLAFSARLREEQRFSGPEALVAQIRDDVERARALLSGLGGEGL